MLDKITTMPHSDFYIKRISLESRETEFVIFEGLLGGIYSSGSHLASLYFLIYEREYRTKQENFELGMVCRR